MIENNKWGEVLVPEVLFFQEGPGVRNTQFRESGVKLLNVGNINNGTINLSSTKTHLSEEEAYGKYSHFLVDEGDLLIASSGIIVENFHNKIAFASSEHLPLCLNTSTMRFKPLNKEDLYILFFKYFLQSDGFKSQLVKLITGSAQLNFGPSHIKKIKIPLPPLPQQQKIAAILDAADAVRQNDKVLVAKYDELTQALFLDMFGDPVSNPKGWVLVSLSQYGSFKNGLNFNKNESGISLKYLGVGDFKSKSRIDDIENLSNIELNSLPNTGYLLKDGDLVFVRSNGNKALVGRCIEVYPKETKLTFSGFCIRYRVTSSLIKPTYLAQLFRNKSFKTLMLQSGQGANIQNINQQILSGIDVPLPPIELQNQFVERISLIEEQKTIAQASLLKSEELFNSLLQKAFKGELVN